MDRSLTFLLSCSSSLGSGGPNRCTSSSYRGFSESWECAFVIFLFLVVRRRKQNYDLDTSLAHGGAFRGEDVVNAHRFLYVTSTLVKLMGHFWKPSVVVCSPDSSERASRWPESLGCFEDAVLCGSSTSGSCAANQQTREISLSSGCACNGLGLQLLSR